MTCYCEGTGAVCNPSRRSLNCPSIDLDLPAVGHNEGDGNYNTRQGKEEVEEKEGHRTKDKCQGTEERKDVRQNEESPHKLVGQSR